MNGLPWACHGKDPPRICNSKCSLGGCRGKGLLGSSMGRICQGSAKNRRRICWSSFAPTHCSRIRQSRNQKPGTNRLAQKWGDGGALVWSHRRINKYPKLQQVCINKADDWREGTFADGAKASTPFDAIAQSKKIETREIIVLIANL